MGNNANQSGVSNSSNGTRPSGFHQDPFGVRAARLADTPKTEVPDDADGGRRPFPWRLLLCFPQLSPQQVVLHGRQALFRALRWRLAAAEQHVEHNSVGVQIDLRLSTATNVIVSATSDNGCCRCRC